MKRIRPLLISAALFGPIAAHAQETTTYTYDAKGRFVVAARTGTVDTGAQSVYGHDRADNRVRITAGLPGTSTFDASDPAAAIEGSALVFTVTRSGTLNAVQTVNFASGGGTANAGADYGAALGTLTFAAGETVKTVSLATIDDALIEATETVQVSLSAPTAGAVIGAATATGSISDNDAPPPVITALNPSYSPLNNNILTFSLNALAATYGQAATISSFAPAPGNGTAVLAADGGSVTYTAPNPRAPLCEAGGIITFSVPYVIRNSVNGGLTQGIVSFSMTQLDGPRPIPPAVCP